MADGKLDDDKVYASLNHSLLSPSGKMSKAARARAIERERVKLFGKNGLAWPTCPQPTKKEQLLRWADELDKLADSGMKPRAYRKKAAQMRAEAEALA